MGIMLGNLSVKDIETRLGSTLSAEDVAVLQEKTPGERQCPPCKWEVALL